MKRTSFYGRIVKRTLALALAMTLGVAMQAQKITWGQKLTMKKGYNPYIISEDNEYFYTCFWQKSKINLEKFQKGSNSRIFVKTLDLPKGLVEEISFVGDNFVVFLSVFDKKADEMNIYANTYSGSDGKLVKDMARIMSVPVEKKRRRGTFNVTVAEGRQRMLISHFAYYKKQEKYRQRFLLLDENMNKVTEREDVTGKKEARDYKNEGLAVDADGSFYFMKSFDDGRKHIVVYDASKDYEKWEENIDYKTLGLPVNSRVYAMSATTNKKKDMVMVGYYTKERETMDGAFYLRVDNKSKEIVTLKLNEFSKEFKDQFLTKRDIKKGRDAKVKNQFGAMHLYKTDDGDVIGVGEVFEYTYYESRGSVSESYHYGDLVAVSLSSDGEMKWAHRIPKNQIFRYSTQGPFIFSSTGLKFFVISTKPVDYMSYFATLSKDKFYIVYNDNAKNLAKKTMQDKQTAFKKPTQAVMSICAIDLKTGQKTKSAFFGGKDYDITVEPAKVYQTSQGTSPILMGSRKKTFKYGLMDF